MTSATDFAKPVIMSFLGGSMADHVASGLKHIFTKRPTSGSKGFSMKINDDRTGLNITLRGEMKSLRARNWRTKYDVTIQNVREHQEILIHIQDDHTGSTGIYPRNPGIHLTALTQGLGRRMRLNTMDDPTVMFEWLKMNASRNFICPQDVVASGNVTGNIWTPDPFQWEALEFPAVTEIQGPNFINAITMRSVQQSQFT